jgi:hypothetical protein
MMAYPKGTKAYPRAIKTQFKTVETHLRRGGLPLKLKSLTLEK